MRFDILFIHRWQAVHLARNDSFGADFKRLEPLCVHKLPNFRLKNLSVVLVDILIYTGIFLRLERLSLVIYLIDSLDTSLFWQRLNFKPLELGHA